MSATFTTQKGRGRLFVKGQAKIASSGRRKGVPNLATKATKAMIEAAARGLGGTARLIEWAKEDPRNEYAFWIYLWPRLLPLQIQGSGSHGEIELNVKLSSEELTQKLRERGLPLAAFGIDKPMLELEAASSRPSQFDPRIAADALAGDPTPLLEVIEEQIAGDSESDRRDRTYLETRMRQHIERYGGST
jgi:hypothetical protein